MDASVKRRIHTLPPGLREPLEIAEMLVRDLARRFVEGTVSLRQLEEARNVFAQILECARAYLRDELEREIFAFPRATRPVAPSAH